MKLMPPLRLPFVPIPSIVAASEATGDDSEASRSVTNGTGEVKGARGTTALRVHRPSTLQITTGSRSYSSTRLSGQVDRDS